MKVNKLAKPGKANFGSPGRLGKTTPCTAGYPMSGADRSPKLCNKVYPGGALQPVKDCQNLALTEVQ